MDLLTPLPPPPASLSSKSAPRHSVPSTVLSQGVGSEAPGVGTPALQATLRLPCSSVWSYSAPVSSVGSFGDPLIQVYLDLMSSLLYSSFHSAGNGPRVTVDKCPPSVLHTSPPHLCFIAHRHEHHTGFWWFACNLERVVTPCHKILLNVVWDFSFAQLLCWHHCGNAEDPQSTLAYHFLKISPYYGKSLFVILKCPPSSKWCKYLHRTVCKSILPACASIFCLIHVLMRSWKEGLGCPLPWLLRALYTVQEPMEVRSLAELWLFALTDPVCGPDDGGWLHWGKGTWFTENMRRIRAPKR